MDRFFEQLRDALQLLGTKVSYIHGNTILIAGCPFYGTILYRTRTVKFLGKKFKLLLDGTYDINAVIVEVVKALPAKLETKRRGELLLASRKHAEVMKEAFQNTPFANVLDFEGTMDGLRFTFTHPDPATSMAAIDLLSEMGMCEIEERKQENAVDHYLVAFILQKYALLSEEAKLIVRDAIK